MPIQNWIKKASQCSGLRNTFLLSVIVGGSALTAHAQYDATHTPNPALMRYNPLLAPAGLPNPDIYRVWEIDNLKSVVSKLALVPTGFDPIQAPWSFGSYVFTWSDGMTYELQTGQGYAMFLAEVYDPQDGAYGVISSANVPDGFYAHGAVTQMLELMGYLGNGQPLYGYTYYYYFTHDNINWVKAPGHTYGQGALPNMNDPFVPVAGPEGQFLWSW